MWVGGAVINFDGLSMSWSDTLLDFISIVTTQRYMKTISDVIQIFKHPNFQIECQFYT